MNLSTMFKIGMFVTTWLIGIMVFYLYWTRRKHPAPRNSPGAGSSALAGRITGVATELRGPVSGASAAVWFAREKHAEEASSTRACDWADLTLVLADGAAIRLRVDGPPQISGAHVVRGSVREDLAEQSHPFKVGQLHPGDRVMERSVRVGDEVYVTGWFVRDPADATEDPMRRAEDPEPETWRVAKDDTGAPPLIHVGRHRDFAFGRRAWREYYGIGAKLFLWTLGLFTLLEIVAQTSAP